jgi:ribonuclease E
MARKELLLAGFRNVKMVAGMVKQRKAAQLLAATSKLPTGSYLSGEVVPLPPHLCRKAAGTHPQALPPTPRAAPPLSAAGTTAQKAPAAAPATPANPAQQLKEAGVQRTAPAAPSFAASSAAAPAAAPRGLFGGLARRVAEAQARAAPEPRPLESPSFAATPGWPKFRKKLTDRDDAQMAAIAQQLTAAEARRRIPPGAPRNPLFWWAKLGEPAVPAAAKKAAAEQPAGKQLRQALKSYAELAPSAAPKPAAPKLRPMAAWHKYAMMK